MTQLQTGSVEGLKWWEDRHNICFPFPCLDREEVLKVLVIYENKLQYVYLREEYLVSYLFEVKLVTVSVYYVV